MGGMVAGLLGSSAAGTAASSAASSTLANTASSALTNAASSDDGIDGMISQYTDGLLDSSVKPTEQVADHTFGNFVNGYNKASTMGGIRANVMDGNIASAAGGMLRMGEGMPDSQSGQRQGIEQFTKGAWQQPQMQGLGGGGGYQRGINSFSKRQY